MLQHLTDASRYVELLARATLVVCAFRFRFTIRYRWFACYIAAQLIRSCFLFLLDYHSRLYAQIWSITQPILWVFQVGAVLELIRLVFQQKNTAGRLSRHLLVYYGPLSVLISVIVSLFEPMNLVAQPLWLSSTVNITKWLAWVCLFLPIAQELLDLSDSRPLSYDVSLHRRLLILYVGITPGMMSILSLLEDRHAADVATFCSEISFILCLVLWIWLMLRHKGVAFSSGASAEV